MKTFYLSKGNLHPSETKIHRAIPEMIMDMRTGDCFFGNDDLVCILHNVHLLIPSLDQPVGSCTEVIVETENDVSTIRTTTRKISTKVTIK